MRYITELERDGIKKGLAQGIEQGIEQGSRLEAQKIVKRLLNRRFGQISPDLTKQIDTLDVKALEDLSDQLLTFSSVADLENSLKQN